MRFLRAETEVYSSLHPPSTVLGADYIFNFVNNVCSIQPRNTWPSGTSTHPPTHPLHPLTLLFLDRSHPKKKKKKKFGKSLSNPNESKFLNLIFKSIPVLNLYLPLPLPYLAYKNRSSFRNKVSSEKTWPATRMKWYSWQALSTWLGHVLS